MSMQSSDSGSSSNMNPKSSGDAAAVPLDPMDVDPVDDGPRRVVTPPIPVVAGFMSSPSSFSPGVLQLASPEAMVVTTEQDAKQCLDWLRSEDLSLRVPAAHRLDAVARWLGPERTRSVSGWIFLLGCVCVAMLVLILLFIYYSL